MLYFYNFLVIMKTSHEIEAKDMPLEALKQAIRNGRYVVSRHARKRMAERGLKLDDLLVAMEGAELIEHDPETRGYPLPLWLVLGWLPGGEPIHMLWGFEEERGEAVLVTAYRPDPDKWIDYRRRR